MGPTLKLQSNLGASVTDVVKRLPTRQARRQMLEDGTAISLDDVSFLEEVKSQEAFSYRVFPEEPRASRIAMRSSPGIVRGRDGRAGAINVQ